VGFCDTSNKPSHSIKGDCHFLKKGHCCVELGKSMPRSSVTIVTRLRVGRQVFDSRQRKRRDFFLFAITSRPNLRPNQPPIQRAPGAPSLRVRQLGRKVGHSPPYSAEVKNT